MIFEGIVLLLVGIFWLAIRYTLWGGICMLVAGVLCFVYPAGWAVAIPLLGAVIALLFSDTSKLKGNY